MAYGIAIQSVNNTTKQVDMNMKNSSPEDENEDSIWDEGRSQSFELPKNDCDRSLDQRDWMIPLLYRSTTKTQEKFNPYTKRNSDQEQSIGKIRIDCRMTDSSTTQMCTSSCSSSSSSSSSPSLSSPLQSTRKSSFMTRRPSTRIHRYLDDASSLGENRDVFTICDRIGHTRSLSLEQWSHDYKSQENSVDISCSELKSLQYAESSPIVDRNDVSDLAHGDMDVFPIEDMTVWSLDWNESLPLESPTHVLRISPKWEAFNTGLDDDVDISPISDDQTPLIIHGKHVHFPHGHFLGRNTLQLVSGRRTPSSSSYSVNFMTCTKMDKHNRYKVLPPEASEALPYLPDLTFVAKKPNHLNEDWCERTQMTQMTETTTSSSVYTKDISTSEQLSTEASSCNGEDEGEIESLTTNDEALQVGDTVHCWSTCDEEAVRSGSDWTLVFATGWSEVDGREFYHVHTHVLGKASSFFRKKFREKGKRCSIVKVDKSLVSAVPYMLDFIYSQSFDHVESTMMDPATAFSLRRLADRFGIRGLKQAMDRLFD